MRFTVVVSTRNRPDDLARAVASVFAQTVGDVEAVVVDDGSDPVHRAAYDAIAQHYGARLRMFRLPSLRGGHGPAYRRNFGASQSAADYIAFLDDGDTWTDPGFLAQITRGLDGERREIDGFHHLSTTVVDRAFFWRIGGFDETLHNEEALDFHLRAIDAAGLVQHTPVEPACHHVPTRTATSPERWIAQLQMFNKAILFLHHHEIKDYARHQKAHTMKRIAQKIWRNGDLNTALYYALRAFCLEPGLKWLLFCLRLWVGRLTCRPGQRAFGAAGQEPP